MIFAGAALVAAGILAAIPSGGSSLLVSLAGAASMLTGLSTALTLLLGITAIGAVGLTGVLMREAASKKALSEVLSDFTDTAKQESEVQQNTGTEETDISAHISAREETDETLPNSMLKT